MASDLCDAMLPHVPRARVAAGPASWRCSARGRGSEGPTRPVPFAVLWARPTLESVTPAGPCLQARAPQSDSTLLILPQFFGRNNNLSLLSSLIVLNKLHFSRKLLCHPYLFGK